MSAKKRTKRSVRSPKKSPKKVTFKSKKAIMGKRVIRRKFSSNKNLSQDYYILQNVPTPKEVQVKTPKPIMEEPQIETIVKKVEPKKLVVKKEAPKKVEVKKQASVSISEYSLEQMREDSLNKKILVKLRDVNVTFGLEGQGTKAMNNISLNIYEGETLGLVGESGSGKSTTGNAIMGLVDRQTGDIEVDGIYIPNRRKYIKNSLRKKLALKQQMIFQDPANSLNSQKTIYKIISEGLDNVDVKKIFFRQFDGNTMSRMFKILPKHYEFSTKYLAGKTKKTINHDYLMNEIEKGNTEQLRDVLYTKIQKELRKSNTPKTNLAATFLDLRTQERDFFANKKEKIKENIISDIIKSVGLSRKVYNRYPLEFSGGQQQRIGISRAVSLFPKFIVADEPISALDVSIQSQVVNIFNDLKESMGLTILFIAHDLRMVEYISDRIVVMYRGKILEIGDANEITNNPIHPYTKTLYASVPSIDKTKTDLTSYEYKESMHDYSKENPLWYKIGNKEHFVFGTKSEIERWVKNGK